MIVAADASWIFIGLYALDRWKDDFIGWIGAGAFLDMVKAGIVGFSMEAHAAAAGTAVEFQEPGSPRRRRSCFFYALLPLVWLVMAAIVYGYDLSAKPVALPRRLLAPPRCANGWPISPPTSSEATGPATGRSGPACARCSAPASGRCSPSSCFTAPPAGSPPGRGTAQPVISGRTISKTWQRIGDVLAVVVGSPTELDGGILSLRCGSPAGRHAGIRSVPIGEPAARRLMVTALFQENRRRASQGK
ncbi:hypothetical protein [Sinorhizobium meliloti]|uniref:hypothetical protein n=1 Tax=Rhizobium meliloti TaxID=382 RepID=UPI00237FF560|nr:hypothetical protein [Sinorhizobium meliloti]